MVAALCSKFEDSSDRPFRSTRESGPAAARSSIGSLVHDLQTPLVEVGQIAAPARTERAARVVCVRLDAFAVLEGPTVTEIRE